MFMISIQKGHHFKDESSAVVGPFEVFKCSSAFARQQGGRNPKLLAVEDYLGLIAHRPDLEIRQLAKNAGLDGALPMGELKEALRAFAEKVKEPALVEDPEAPAQKEGDEEPSPVGDVDTDEMQAELLEMTVNDLRKLASDLNVPGYANVRKTELVELILDAMQGDDEQ